MLVSGMATKQNSWWRTPLLHRSPRLQQREDQIFLVLALVIGVLTGLAVVAFIVLTERLGMRLYPAAGSPWRRLLFPIAGSLTMGWLLYRYFPYARGSGVPQTKAALFAREGQIRLHTVIGKFFCTSATLASGIPLGREGPSVQVGAGIASVLGRSLGLSTDKVKSLLPVGAAAAVSAAFNTPLAAGAAAAVSAAFNTPLAAVLFSLEEIVGDLHAPVLGSVVLASATSWMVLRLLLGNSPLFKVPQYELVNSAEFGIYALLGVASGLVSVAFSQLLLRMRAWFVTLPPTSAWIHPAAGGVLVGVIGWFVPQVLGVGYGFVGGALNGKMTLELMAMLVVLKLLTVTTSYASGNAGGIFGPALFLGAMLGGSIGNVAHHLFPAGTATAGAYAIVGMGAMFAGIVRAPMTSVLMIFEMTQDYAVIVPLMISNLISLFIASRLQRTPIYEALAVQDGIHLPSTETRPRHGERQVAIIMRPAPASVAASLAPAEAIALLRARNAGTALVSDTRGLVGVLSLSALEHASDQDKKLVDLVNPLAFPHVHADHGLHLALERLGSNRLDLLPVVSRANAHQLLGVVTLRDVLQSYGVGDESETHMIAPQ
jgi:CIC family chloride channel protein